MDDRGRSNQQFVVDVVVRKDGQERRLSVAGCDIYAVTAPIVVETMDQLCKRRQGGGAFAVGELVDASAFVAELVRRGDIRPSEFEAAR